MCNTIQMTTVIRYLGTTKWKEGITQGGKNSIQCFEGD